MAVFFLLRVVSPQGHFSSAWFSSMEVCRWSHQFLFRVVSPHGVSSQGGLILMLVLHHGGLFWLKFLYRVVSQLVGFFSEWSLLMEVSDQCGVSSGWSLLIVVLLQGGVSSRWCLLMLVSSQGDLMAVSHQCGVLRVVSSSGSSDGSLSSWQFLLRMVSPYCSFSPGWSLLMVGSHQGGLSSLRFLIRVVSFHDGFLSGWFLLGVVSSHDGFSYMWSLLKVVSYDVFFP